MRDRGGGRKPSGTADGTAVAGEDYTATSGTLVVKGSDSFRYLMDGKTLSAFGTRVGAG